MHGVASVSLRNSTGETPKDVAKRFTRLGCLAVLGGGTAGWLATSEIMYCYTHSIRQSLKSFARLIWCLVDLTGFECYTK